MKAMSICAGVFLTESCGCGCVCSFPNRSPNSVCCVLYGLAVHCASFSSFAWLLGCSSEQFFCLVLSPLSSFLSPPFHFALVCQGLTTLPPPLSSVSLLSCLLSPPTSLLFPFSHLLCHLFSLLSSLSPPSLLLHCVKGYICDLSPSVQHARELAQASDGLFLSVFFTFVSLSVADSFCCFSLCSLALCVSSACCCLSRLASFSLLTLFVFSLLTLFALSLSRSLLLSLSHAAHSSCFAREESREDREE